MTATLLDDLKNGLIAPEIRDYWLSLVDGNVDRLEDDTSQYNSVSNIGCLYARTQDLDMGEIHILIAKRTSLSLIVSIDTFYCGQGENFCFFHSQKEFVRFLKLRSFA